ncbi:MAG: hypothetical protein M3Y21_12160, partial [Candidatus Eremiobacteraeota bacterium]|nr:hypothetical protein [Candidatus Eremiobacteraeota bacterium]
VLVNHYRIAAPMLARSLGAIPIVSVSFRDGFDAPAQWHLGLQHVPDGVASVQVQSSYGGSSRYLRLDGPAIEWACHALGAVEFHSWSPVSSDPQKLAFARILLEPAGATDFERVKQGAVVVRARLAELGLKAIVLLDGRVGIALWIPFSDAPNYDPVREWLHRFASDAAIARADLLTTEPNTHADGRVHIHVSKNSPGTFSALPYSARGVAGLPVCLPIAWPELELLNNGDVCVDSFERRLQAVGDVFAAEVNAIGEQQFAIVADSLQSRVLITSAGDGTQVHGHVLNAAIQILSAGGSFSAEELFEEAVQRTLLPASFNAKYVYTALIEYIARANGNGRKPQVVQDADRKFRMNEPPDDWPAIAVPPPMAIDAQTQALIDRLGVTAKGPDSAAFEVAVCDAFAHLGFAATHVGGYKGSDGYADAQLGPLAYRAMIECRTASGDVVTQPDAVEAAKYRQAYNGQYCALVGPAFPDQVSLTSELQTHVVSAWTAGDLQTLLTIGSDPLEMRALFVPGFASDALNDLLWERKHGVAKRVRAVAQMICEAGWKLQVSAASEGAPSDAPRTTSDVAMALVTQKLAEEGAHQSCSRAEVGLAFEYLTNPITRRAAWVDDQHDAIVILHG